MIASILAAAICKALPARKQVPQVRSQEISRDSPLQGMRFQLLLALGVLNRGHMAVIRIDRPLGGGGGVWEQRPQMDCTPDRSFAEHVLALWVPGTMHPAPVGKALLELGWIKPAKREHWVPLLRYFEISESGRLNLQRAREWWNQLGMIEKLLTMVAE